MTRDPDFNIPPKFWQSLTDEEYREICDTSELNRKMCRRLWAIMGYATRPPHRLLVLLKADDVKRLLPGNHQIH